MAIMYSPPTSAGLRVVLSGWMIHRAQFEQWVPFPISEVFLFFADPGNLVKIMPPSAGAEIVSTRLAPPPAFQMPASTLADGPPRAGAGSEIVASFRIVPFLPFRARWIALITEFEWNHHFADVQKKGPFRSFRHRHQFAVVMRDGINGTVVRDLIEYDIGWGILGELAQRFFVGPQFERIFRYRQSTLEKLLASAPSS
jgi:ligand-binding SRPBCC domain-containing protein